MSKCLTCGRTIPVNRKFCSMSCQNNFRKGKTIEEIYGEERARELRETQYKKRTNPKLCKYCGKVFLSHSSRRLFCCQGCCYKWRKGKKIEEFMNAEGAKNLREGAKRRRGKTYEEIYGEEGAKEQREKRYSRILLTCHQCGKEFYVNSYMSNTKFCSRDCFYDSRDGSILNQDMHTLGIEKLTNYLESNGYICFPIGKRGFPKPDIIAFKNGTSEIFEVGYTHENKKKYEKEKGKLFKKVYWFRVREENIFDEEGNLVTEEYQLFKDSK